jgi:FkbM family methyltransferase
MLQRLGLDLVRYGPDRFPELRRARLLRQQPVDVVLDVGANAGQYVSGLRSAGYGGRIVSFEPLEDAYRRLERRAATDPAWDCRRVALGERSGVSMIHVAGNSSSSSLLPMAARHVQSAPESAYVSEEQVEVRPLDDLAGELVLPGDRVWLKLDVQGFELPVLHGGERTLEQVVVLETELSLVELYQGQALLPEVYAYLVTRGFGVWFLEPVLRDPLTGELLQVDGVFVRRS